MPYIKQEQRDYLDSFISSLATRIDNLIEDSNYDETALAGVMNYTITKLILSVYGQDLKYHQHNAVIGFLECAKQEFYRRSTGIYENKKIKDNGDVY